MANRGGSAASTALRCFIIFHRLSTLFLVHYVRPIISDRLSDCSFDSRRRRHSIRCLYRGPVLSPHSFWTVQRVSRSDSHGTRATVDFRVQSPFNEAMFDLCETTHWMVHVPWLGRILQALPSNLVTFLQPQMATVIKFNEVGYLALLCVTYTNRPSRR